MMRLDIYEQQEVATGAKQITSSVVGKIFAYWFCLTWMRSPMSCLCSLSVCVCSLFVCVCIVHPPPQLESTTSCVVVRDNENRTRLPPCCSHIRLLYLHMLCSKTQYNTNKTDGDDLSVKDQEETRKHIKKEVPPDLASGTLLGSLVCYSN